MNPFKRALTVSIAALLCLAASACNREPLTPPIDKTKTQLYVGIHDGGYRKNWADTWGEKFERLHAETRFEEGKLGVEVIVNMDGYAQDSAALSLTTKQDELVFTEQANYYEFIRNDTALDITEWVTEPLTEYGEDESIAEKMSDWDREYFGQNTTAPQYYGVPWYTAFMCINYDVGLFDQENLYFDTQGRLICDVSDYFGGAGLIKPLDELKGYGPDGRTGVDQTTGNDYSIDDGTPATYDQFFLLCDAMVERGITPVIWSGSVQHYVTYLVDTLAADAEGYENMALNFTYDGSPADNLVKRIENGLVTLEEQATSIGSENGYLLTKQAGKYYALKFLHRLISTTDESGNPKYYNYTDCYSKSVSHKAAQTKFLRSRSNNAPIGMLIDGTWWYNEAGDTFRSMSSIAGMGQKERKIGFLSMPKPTENYKYTDATLMSSWTTAVVVRKNVDPAKHKVIREFFRFIHTDENLSSFVADANGVRPFEYELSQAAKSNSSHYALQQYSMYRNSKTVNPYSTHPIARNYLSLLRGYNSIIDGETAVNVTTAFDPMSRTKTAEQYFDGLSRYMTEDVWRSRFLTGIL